MEPATFQEVQEVIKNSSQVLAFVYSGAQLHRGDFFDYCPSFTSSADIRQLSVNVDKFTQVPYQSWGVKRIPALVLFRQGEVDDIIHPNFYTTRPDCVADMKAAQELASEQMRKCFWKDVSTTSNTNTSSSSNNNNNGNSRVATPGSE